MNLSFGLNHGPGKGSPRPRNFGQDVRGAGRPDEWLGLDVVVRHVQLDGQLQCGDAGETVAPDAVLRNVAKEPLDHVQPGGAGGREVHDEARVLGQPFLNLGMLDLWLGTTHLTGQ